MSTVSDKKNWESELKILQDTFAYYRKQAVVHRSETFLIGERVTLAMVYENGKSVYYCSSGNWAKKKIRPGYISRMMREGYLPAVDMKGNPIIDIDLCLSRVLCITG